MLTHQVVFWDRRLSPVEHQFQVLKRVGIAHFDETIELWTEPESDAYISRELDASAKGATKRRVGLVLGASPRWPTKQWPVERFLELSKQLVRRFDCQIVLLGTEEDQKQARLFDESNLKQVLNLTGKTSFAQLVSLIKQLDVLVTGDTAPLHMASAFKTKIVALFGPTEPKRHMPPGKGHIALVKRIPCQPCYSGTCTNPDKLLCLREISVNEVLEAVGRQFELTSPPLFKAELTI